MDIYCPKCGEPWDQEELHDIEGKTYAEANLAFRRTGCAVFGEKCEGENTQAAMLAAAAYEMLGDDLDAAAAELEEWV